MSTCASDDRIINDTSIVFSGSPGPPIPPPPEALEAEQRDLVQKYQDQLDATIFRLLLSVHTTEEFVKLRAELYPKYRRLAGLVSSIVENGIATEPVEEVLQTTFDAIEKLVFEDHRLFIGNDEGREEALFSIDALKRTHFLLCQVSSTPAVEQGKREHDAGLLVKCLSLMWWSQLHLRCLLFAISHPADVLPTAPVRDAILDGLRSSVMAYSAVRQAWGIRFDSIFEVDNDPEVGEFDLVSPEDLSLLNESEEDFNLIVAISNRKHDRSLHGRP